MRIALHVGNALLSNAAVAAWALAILPTNGSGGDKKSPTPAEVKERLFKTSWLEVKRVCAGKEVVDPEQLCCYHFSPKGSSCWGRRGELSAAPMPPHRIDATTQPMRITAVGEPTLDKNNNNNRIVRVRPCIFKFEDGMLIIAGKEFWPDEQTFHKGKDYSERPRDFSSTKQNKVTVQYFRPCQYYDQD